MHPLDIPDDAKFASTINSGSPSIEGEGLKLNVWKGSMPDMKGGEEGLLNNTFAIGWT